MMREGDRLQVVNTEMYYRIVHLNLYDFINQYHPNQYNKKISFGWGEVEGRGESADNCN